jgi:DNA adenine methylase
VRVKRSADAEARPPVPAADAPAGSRGRRPLLKWPGGKRQLLPVFGRFYPAEFGRYVEPFLGSGAVFFDLLAAGRLEGRGVELADRNPDLIGCYLAVRDQADAVIEALAALDEQHAAGGAACYYAVRDRFNAMRAELGADRHASAYVPPLAAMLIYLNRTGFNGLFRLNAGGRFNVPAGRYAKPHICDARLVQAVSAAFRRPGVTLRQAIVEEAVSGARPGDFLYFDPPYAPLSATSAFGAYTADRFTPGDQRQLCATVADLAARGCHVMLSNSSAPEIVDLYRDAVRTSRGAGLALWGVPARRAINSRASSRGHVAELLLSNLAPRPARAGEPALDALG